MIFFILAGIACLLCILVFWGEWFGMFWSSFVVSCFILIPGVVIGLIFSWQPDPQPHPTTQLVNLQDSSGVYGRFFLGSGTIREYPAYYYYKEIAPGQYTYNNLVQEPGTAQIVVFTDEENNPYLKTLQECYKQTDSFWWVSVNGSFCNIIQQEFHVPKDSIIQNFKLDAAK